LTNATKIAILKCELIKERLKGNFENLIQLVTKAELLHEMIVDCESSKR